MSKQIQKTSATNMLLVLDTEAANIVATHPIATTALKARNHNHLDIACNIANLKGGTAILLFWGVRTSNRSGKHQPLIWCNPRFNGRGDNSVYNRLFLSVELKTIMTVFGGFLNSPIAKASINILKIHTYFGNQNIGSLVIVNCFRPFCFNIQGGQNA